MVNDWNRLGRHVVSAESMGSFKRQLDEWVKGIHKANTDQVIKIISQDRTS